MKLLDDEGKRFKLLCNIVVLAISLFVITRTDRTYHHSSAFDALMIDALAPMQRSLTYLKSEVSEMIDHYLINISASKENTRLQEEVFRLQGRTLRLDELLLENERLRELLQFGEEIPEQKVLAQIVAWDSSSDFKVLRINKGLRHGLRLQAPVVTSRGVVGYVYRLSNNFADVLTILDSNNRVDAIIQRTRSHGIVEGFSQGTCLMKYVTRTGPIVIGDKVLTSGMGIIYPKGLLVGKVMRIERESAGITQRVEVVPSVDFGDLEEVMVLISPEKKLDKLDWKSLDEQSEEANADEASKS